MSDLFGKKKMLALSWKQPFGTLMLYGKIETRVWNTSYRGLVLICSSKKGYGILEMREIMGERNMYRMASLPYIEKFNGLDGYAIGVGRLVNTKEMAPEDSDRAFVQYRAPWTEHRKGKDGIVRAVHQKLYSHFYEDVRPILPFPWKGCQGWKEVTEEIKSKINFL